jgi:DNA helicase-2/ATP-dependent DNA helicase PcrA
VDEFQDTNYIQFELLKLLAEDHKNLTVVGDDDQSIFRFRGASLENIKNFSRVYPEAEKVVLTKNYRSTQDILDSAYQLIQHNNPDRLEILEKIQKSLEATAESRMKSLHMLQFDTLSHEAEKIAKSILDRLEEGYGYSDIAILVRRNADADPFLRALNMQEIPFRFSGSRGLYSQEEVKILMAFIKALTDFEDSHSLFHLALSDIYNLDPYDLTKATNFSRGKNLPLHSVFRAVAQGQDHLDIKPTSRKAIKKIFQDLMDLISLAGKKNAGEVLYAFMERSGYLKSLVAVSSLENEVRIKNIRLFFDKVKGFSELTDDSSIQAFSGYLDLLQQVGDNPATAEAELDVDAVQVLTFHKAKGLEFPVVFMVNLIMDRFPGRSRREKISIPNEILKEDLPQKENVIQEERRLFYVGMTRAKKILYMTWAQDHGMKRLKKVSPFVLEALDLPAIPEGVLKSSPLEELQRFAPREKHKKPARKKDMASLIQLSYFQVDSYLTCPFKYKIKHVFRLTGPPHHNLVFGRVLHSTIHHYLKNKIAGKKTSEREFLALFKKSWLNEGFLSREHEEMRKKAGEKALKFFYRREESSSRLPQALEKEFRWQEGDMRFQGRWDRVDHTDEGAVIIDFKATEVKDQKTADKKAKESLQMDIYALSFLKTEKIPLVETNLHFLESDIIGQAHKGEKELQRAEDKIAEAEDGIRRQDFRPSPDWHNCSHCEFRTFCPHSYAY